MYLVCLCVLCLNVATHQMKTFAQVNNWNQPRRKTCLSRATDTARNAGFSFECSSKRLALVHLWLCHTSPSSSNGFTPSTDKAFSAHVQTLKHECVERCYSISVYIFALTFTLRLKKRKYIYQKKLPCWCALFIELKRELIIFLKCCTETEGAERLDIGDKRKVQKYWHSHVSALSL